MTEEEFQNLPKGGYIVPEVVRRKRPGLVAAVKRLLNCAGGWEDYRLADAMREEASQMAKGVVGMMQKIIQLRAINEQKETE